MENAYHTAMCRIADAYEAATASAGGKSLSRVATIVLSSGTFFARLRAGKPFYVHNLDRLANWFQDPAHWPHGHIPNDAIVALNSIGRSPLPRQCGIYNASVQRDNAQILQGPSA